MVFDTSEKKRKVPWTDFAGNALYEGDMIQHPSGERGLIVFKEEYDNPPDQWRVEYGKDSITRLCLQIGDKGQAVKE